MLQLRAHFSLLVRHQSAACLYRNEWPLSILKSYFCAPHPSFLLSQAFVDFLSRGLDAEYKSKGIIVQVSRTSPSTRRRAGRTTPPTGMLCVRATNFVSVISSRQSVLPFFVATKMSNIRRATLTAPTPERYVSSALSTVGLESQTNGYWPHAVMVPPDYVILDSNTLKCLFTSHSKLDPQSLFVCVCARVGLV